MTLLRSCSEIFLTRRREKPCEQNFISMSLSGVQYARFLVALPLLDVGMSLRSPGVQARTAVFHVLPYTASSQVLRLRSERWQASVPRCLPWALGSAQRSVGCIARCCC
ncbi:MAG: hypothetical protein U0165_09890 [Polyangiaceae bacterium]